MAYRLEGNLLEVCNCNILCPCWVGEDPDNGTCDTIVSWNFKSGEIDGVDVSGLTIAALAHVPGNILEGNWTAAIYVDDAASPEQEEAILSVYTGKQGGPVADLVQLIGEVVSVERAPMKVDIVEGKGSIRIGDNIGADMEPFRGATGEVSTLVDSAFSTVPGAAAWVGKASNFFAKNEKLGFDIDLQGHNAIQGTFVFVG